MGLGRVAAFISVPSQQHQVNAFGQGELDNLVQGVEEITQPRRKPGLRVDTAVVLHTDMQVRKMEDSHPSSPPRYQYLTAEIMSLGGHKKQEELGRDSGLPGGSIT